MDFDTLRYNLQQPYLQTNWKDWLLQLFGQQISIETKPEEIIVQKGNAKSIERFASISLSDDKNIAVLEVKTTAAIQIARNRVALRDIAFKLIDQDKYHGLLVFYHSADKKQLDYRLSFISSITTLDTEGNFITQNTHAKRYSFVLGANESCTTASLRLIELKSKVRPFKAFENNKRISLKDISDAFSVEKLNNEFFKKYKDIHYKRFWEYIANKPDYAELLIDTDQSDTNKQEKPIRDFVKKMLGRIVFLHFLQKKGWMGSPADSEEWKGGDKNFMLNLFCQFPNKSKFYSKGLTILFFKILNTDRRNKKDVIPIALHYTKPNTKTTFYRVPFLNGGLFDDDLPNTNVFDFPIEYFEDLFDFFSQYNFTIDENSPDEQEVGIDPEMLGHIFENLLEENKDKGAFYTPKEIVHYMCQESLIQYLRTHLPECTEDENEATKAIENFIRKDDIGNRNDKKNFIVANAKRIETVLDKVKICDPAIGSGAFPMGMLQEIFKAKMTLDLTLDKAKVKKDIIQSSIYGVDFERGAVDIARLRFWLSLVVDEETPQPLPNLDYKIMQGDSLLESFENIDLSKLLDDKDEPIVYAQNEQVELFASEQQNVIIFEAADKQKFKELIDLYFDFEEQEQSKYTNKQEVKQAINTIVESKLKTHFYFEKNKLEVELNEQNKKLTANKSYTTDPKGIVDRKNKANEKIQKAINSITNNITRLQYILQKLSQWEQTDKERPYFLWHTYFKDVFDDGGFDIVIGNPPYIQLQKMGEEADKLEKANYKTFTRSGDIYCLFYELAVDLLKNQGALCYITSNSWMKTKYGKSLRSYFASHTAPLKLLNFEDTRIFETAVVETNILLIKKSSFNSAIKAAAIKADYKVGTSLQQYFQENSFLVTELDEEGWIILDRESMMLKAKIHEAGVALKNWNIEINIGILNGFNDAYLIPTKKRNELVAADAKNAEIIKPVLRGRDVKKYGYKWDDLWLINVHNGIKKLGIERINVEKDYPKIYEYLSQFVRELEIRQNKGDHWTNLRNCGYYLEFEKPKIIWGELSDMPKFSYDLQKIYAEATLFAMTGENLKYLLVILNSKVALWFFNQITTTSGMGTSRWKKYKIEQLPIPIIKHDQTLQIKFEVLCDYLTFLNDPTQPPVNSFTDNASIAPVFEDLANMMVYEMYFTQHMKDLEIAVLQFIDTNQRFKPIDTKETANKGVNAKIIGDCYKWLQGQGNPIRNRIILSNIKSPGIIKKINASTH